MGKDRAASAGREKKALETGWDKEVMVEYVSFVLEAVFPKISTSTAEKNSLQSLVPISRPGVWPGPSWPVSPSKLVGSAQGHPLLALPGRSLHRVCLFSGRLSSSVLSLWRDRKPCPAHLAELLRASRTLRHSALSSGYPSLPNPTRIFGRKAPPIWMWPRTQQELGE